MNRRLCFSLIIAAVFPILGGCAAAPHLAFAAANANSIMAGTSTDMDMSTVELVTPMKGDAFISDMRTVAKKLGYQVMNIVAHKNLDAQHVALYKESNPFGTLIGKYQMTQVSLSLEEEGRVIRVGVRINGAGGGTDGEARKVIDEFKSALTARYASR